MGQEPSSCPDPLTTDLGQVTSALGSLSFLCPEWNSKGTPPLPAMLPRPAGTCELSSFRYWSFMLW